MRYLLFKKYNADSLGYDNKKTSRKKDWNYYVYEDDHTIQLSVPIPKPTPGFDVLHTLNESEKEQY